MLMGTKHYLVLASWKSVASHGRPSVRFSKRESHSVERGDAVKVVAVVKSSAGDVTGKVRFKLDGKRIATVKLEDGRAVLKVKLVLARGKHKVVVVYLGSDAALRSKDDARLRVTA